MNPATSQAIAGNQGKASAIAETCCRCPATTAIRATAATASTEYVAPIALPSLPVWPSLSATATALIVTAPLAPPQTNCATLSVRTSVACFAAHADAAATNAPPAITGVPPNRFVSTDVGSISRLNPIQNNERRPGSSVGCASLRNSGSV